MTLALRTFPSLLTTTSCMLASLQWFLGRFSSWTRTTSPACTFLWGLVQRCRCWSSWRYSRFHLIQNCSARYWTLRQRFQLYRSGLWNCPGGGSITPDLAVRRWLGVIGVKLVGSLRVSIVKGRLFTMAAASDIRVLRLSSSNWAPWSLRRDMSTARTVRICHSHMPPMWLACGGLKENSQLCSKKSYGVLCHRFLSRPPAIRCLYQQSWCPCHTIAAVPSLSSSWNVGERLGIRLSTWSWSLQGAQPEKPCK